MLNIHSVPMLTAAVEMPFPIVLLPITASIANNTTPATTTTPKTAAMIMGKNAFPAYFGNVFAVSIRCYLRFGAIFIV